MLSFRAEPRSGAGARVSGQMRNDNIPALRPSARNDIHPLRAGLRTIAPQFRVTAGSRDHASILHCVACRATCLNKKSWA
jgi:hypothetical protein